MTFANARALLVDFLALEIMVVRFALAWVVLVGMQQAGRRGDRNVAPTGRDEWLFAAMGLTCVFVYQFLENYAIYYTNASNVAILVSFGPIVTAAFARVFTKDRSLSFAVVGGSIIAVCGVALVSLNGVLNFNMRPAGDLMALGAMTSWGVYSVLPRQMMSFNAGRLRSPSIVTNAALRLPNVIASNTPLTECRANNPTAFGR